MEFAIARIREILEFQNCDRSGIRQNFACGGAKWVEITAVLKIASRNFWVGSISYFREISRNSQTANSRNCRKFVQASKFRNSVELCARVIPRARTLREHDRSVTIDRVQLDCCLAIVCGFVIARARTRSSARARMRNRLRDAIGCAFVIACSN